MATRMQQRRGTAAQWTSANPVLAAGEIGFEIDTNKFKIGDGINQWGDLEYFTSIDNALLDIVAGAPAALDTLNELAAALGDDASFATTVTNSLSGKQDKVAGVTDTKIGYLANLTSDIQDQLDDKAPLTSPTFIGNVDLPSTTTIGDVTSAQINYLNGVTSDIQTQIDTKAPINGPTFSGTVVLPTSTSIGDVSSDEIGYLNGVTSGIQGQLNNKADEATVSTTYAPINSPTFTGDVVLPVTTTIGNVSATELGHISTVTSNVQDQLDDKAPLESPTFTGTVSGITKAMVGLGNVDNTADADKPISTATQAALNDKADLAGATFSGDVVVEGNLTISGTTTTVNASELVVSDPLVYMADGQYAEDVLDVGFLAATGVAGGTEQSHLHSGFFRDVSDGKKWKLVSNVPHPVNNVVDVTNATRETLVVGSLEATGVVFSDGTQTKQGVPSITPINQKTASYTTVLTDRDSLIEINSASATTLTIPTDASVNYPVGTSFDILQTGAGQVTIAGAGGVTVNATPGLKLRTQWSSATIFKRAANTWVVYGDLTA